MQFYGYNERFKVIRNDEGLVILYIPYSNMVFALDERGYIVFNELLTMLIKYEGFLDEKTLSSVHSRMLSMLIASKVIYKSYEDYISNDFERIYERTNFHLHKAYLHITQRCNLNCVYCYDKNNIGKKEDMSTEQWRYIILELSKKGFDYIVLTGGECMLRADVEDLISYAKGLDLKVHLMSNGTIPLNDRMLELLDYVDISLDSINPKKNELTRRGSQTSQIIEQLVSYDAKYRTKISIKPVVGKINEGSYSELEEFFLSNGFLSVSPMPWEPIDKYHVDTYPDRIRTRKKHKFDAFRKVNKCNACYEVIAVDADGIIYPCQALIREEYKIASIFEDGWVDAIRNSNLTKVFMVNETFSKYCKKCMYRYLCGGPCKAVSYNVTGALSEIMPEYCKLAKNECDDYLKTISFIEKGVNND